MTLNLTMPGREELKPRITVFGVGGAGGNAVNNMIEKELDGVDFVVANTDAQALQQSNAESRVQLGVKVTEGLGAGARASVGAAAAEESIEQIVDHLAGAHMCFITAGMGGGTGTGAAPIIAQAARELGVLTVGVVTKPFQFEGGKRMKQAEDGVEALQKVVDTLIIIPNQNLFRLANEKTTFTEAFSMADDVLYQGVKGVTDLMVRPGLINLDFADVRAVMDEMGKAMMGTGEDSGEDRAIQAAEKAIANPLLDEISLRGAKGVLINITGGHDLTLFELDEAANRIREEVDAEANIIVGSTLDPAMEGSMRVSVVATGIDANENVTDIPVPRRSLAEPLRQHVPSEEHHAPEEDVREEMAEPIAASAEVSEEPSLFSQVEAERAAAEDQMEDIFEPQNAGHEAPARMAPAARAQADDLPPPAYVPPAAAERTQHHEEDLDAYVAPRAPAAGTPSPEAMARLQAAVGNASPRSNPQKTQQSEPQRAAETQAERPRFGINSLLNRMTGHAQESEPQRPARQQPSMQAQPARAEPEDERDEQIEIPAFLRRQAN
ncbi:cell division protein FtsZ [Pseudohalocynthiibacter aestuariivivens]|uniref:Cell division protein FtsZ n=1 Tax=Roseovarius pelagicus TaxID=2980108 RepID=A0ABY6DGW7_9RHOB|nr:MULTISPECIES: cell division protein FtsZ [Rhodobacterales]QIE47239.1 cell division protein FtsZ [Pseudohalocynthiibacter aestuariivivens]UXX84208.1 cell division protein FtsZ [Roseovarius pelagicus]